MALSVLPIVNGVRGYSPMSLGSIFYVDSTHPNANTGNTGLDPLAPMSTIASVVARLTANKGDIVLVAEGHAETVNSAALINLNVSGVKLIGLGEGAKRPTITFTTATTADLDINAANITIENMIFVCGIASQVAMIDVNSTDFTMRDCEFKESSATGLTAIDINGGGANACDRAKIQNCRFYFSAGSVNWDRAIELGEVADGVEITNNLIIGDFDDAGIHNPTGKVLTMLSINGNTIRNAQTGQHAIELVSACTGFAIGNRLITDTASIVFDAGTLSTFDNTYNSLAPTDLGSTPVFASNYVPGLGYKVTKSHNLATDNVDLFTVTGKCAITLLTGEVTTVVGGAATYAMRVKTTNEAIFAATTIDTDAAGTMYLFGGDPTVVLNNAGTPVTRVGFLDSAGPVAPIVVGLTGGSLTIESDLDAADTGVVRWDLFYQPLEVGAGIVAA